MVKDYLHNYAYQQQELELKKPHIYPRLNKKSKVDINKLLNSVKLNKKNEFKQKIFYLISSILALGLMTVFITI